MKVLHTRNTRQTVSVPLKVVEQLNREISKRIKLAMEITWQIIYLNFVVCIFGVQRHRKNVLCALFFGSFDFDFGYDFVYNVIQLDVNLIH